MSVELNYRITGDGQPLILLHGLFGSLDNLGGISRRLQDQWQIHALDQRNHGSSPHTDIMDYPSMADDVLAYMDARELDKVALLGHSMGGKTSMQVALQAPERVDRIIVADIAPVTYRPRHDAVLEGLTSIDLATIRSRQDADEVLADYVEEPGVRQFLLKNLVRVADNERNDYPGTYRWRLNLPVIEQCYSRLAQAPDGDGPFEGPVLFVKGADSAYIQEKHRDEIRRLFPNADLRIINGTGHWLHAEKPDSFAALCRRFLSD
ncbi:alpha/beta fold hydrolase [Marinobacter orientalis]|uniref:Alpha/beta fold hydrolase n=1 Tax=Marinobacter orientalis TaxID=1928859 RepID=A0A7Y0RBN6_9GAMM|nr:alpha/beta fold hydrolase [Marinobacter orientalis]NMT63262.1 alpha/beta fold hydrolase [Marinobacter orientalis]TGX51911.1 alpha/beta fold hydrolase [Marinobacter orientalis]